eukprot:2454804-Pleurochrysis_carterae.AAC.1
MELRIKPLPKLCADGVALGGVVGDVLRALVGERTERRGEPANACAHRLDLLLRVGGSYLVGDVHHLANDAVHGLAALLKDVGDRV